MSQSEPNNYKKILKKMSIEIKRRGRGRPSKCSKLLTNPILPEELSIQERYNILLSWLISTEWVQNFIKQRISPLDKKYQEDYIQECWYQILSIPQEKFLMLYNKGKGKFVNYIKSLINHQIRSISSYLYRMIRQGSERNIYLDDVNWSRLSENLHPDIELSYPEKIGRELQFGIEIAEGIPDISLIDTINENYV